MIYKYAIDFGTTNSSIAIRIKDEKSRVESTIVFSHEGQPTIPSLVYVDNKTDENRIEDIPVGKNARAVSTNSTTGSQRLIREIKIQIDNEKELIRPSAMNRSFHTVSLVAAILRKLKERADEELDKLQIDAHGVVMGVPVSFSDNSKQMLYRALVLAGFYNNEAEAKRLTEFVSEPIAVAVNYGVKVEDKETIMVFDFGGGTLDVAILQLTPKGKYSDTRLPHDVLSKRRETIGGEYLNKLIYQNIFVTHYREELEKYRAQLKIPRTMAIDDIESVWDILSATGAGCQLQDQIEDIKIKLSTEPSWDFQFTGPDGMFFPKTMITLTELYDAISETFDIIQNLVETCIEEAGLKPYDIDDVLLAGGSSLIPCIQDILIEDIGFGDRVRGCMRRKAVPRDVLTSIVRGLSVYGCIEETSNRRIVDDIVDLDYGVWDEEQKKVSIILKRGTKISETEYQETNARGGCYKDYKAVGIEDSYTAIPLTVYCVDGRKKSRLGIIDLNQPGSGQYRIFMKVDSKSGCLIVSIYDRRFVRWYDDIPLSARTFEIGIK